MRYLKGVIISPRPSVAFESFEKINHWFSGSRDIITIKSMDGKDIAMWHFSTFENPFDNNKIQLWSLSNDFAKHIGKEFYFKEMASFGRNTRGRLSETKIFETLFLGSHFLLFAFDENSHIDQYQSLLHQANKYKVSPLAEIDRSKVYWKTRSTQRLLDRNLIDRSREKDFVPNLIDTLSCSILSSSSEHLANISKIQKLKSKLEHQINLDVPINFRSDDLAKHFQDLYQIVEYILDNNLEFRRVISEATKLYASVENSHDIIKISKLREYIEKVQELG